MLSNIEVGDRVRSCLAGWGTVSNIDRYVHVRFDKGAEAIFLKDGKFRVYDLYPEIVEVQKKKWEPEGGSFIVGLNGDIVELPNSMEKSHRLEGREYPTLEKAEKAHSMIRPFQRLVAWLIENDIEGAKSDHYIAKFDGEWRVINIRKNTDYLCLPKMPIGIAKKLCYQLNSGEVEL